MHIYEVIRSPLLSEKMYRQMQNNIYVFLTHTRADKNNIRAAVEKIYNVKVRSVKTLTRNVELRPYKKAVRSRTRVSKRKIAFVRLEKENTINLLEEPFKEKQEKVSIAEKNKSKIKEK
jgi:large subunit ribosomal protein L23